MKSCCENKELELAVLRKEQGRILKIVLAINLIMFFVEFSAGWISQSSALMADSLDMLGDAFVYGFSLFVLHKSMIWTAVAALLKGVIITAFGVVVLIEVIGKAFSDIVPQAQTMGAIGALALIANLTCLYLLTKHRNDDINMKSTFICSRNDIISNTGVITAALAVKFTGTKWPDVIIGLLIASVFLKSAWHILVESISELKARPVKE